MVLALFAFHSQAPGLASYALAGEPNEQVLKAQQQRIAVMKRASAATVAVFGPEGGGGGSGVLISPDGYALTNYHVSSACGDYMRCGLDDGKVYDAVIVGIDATGDVALIKLYGRDDFPTAPLADSSQVRVGQWCFAAGNPFVLATNLQPSISMGIVSGTGRYQYPAGTLLEYADCIQTDAAINPGNSGGPLFNLAGEVIGINGRCSFEKRGRVNVGVGYAISANQLKNFIGMLKSGRLVDHATLGATVTTSSAGRILVSNILSGSDAYRRGLRYGDEVVSLAGRPVDTTNVFKNILGTLPKDWRVPLTYRRDGSEETIYVRLDGVHTATELETLVSAGLGEAPEPPKNPKAPEDSESKDSDDQKQLDAPEENLDDPNQSEQAHPLNKVFIQRAGFANFYFNKTNTDALWEQSRSAYDQRLSKANWTLRGKLGGESTAFTLALDEKTARLSLGNRTINQDLSASVSDTIHARGEGGLPIAIQALKEYVSKGPELLGDTVYLGEMPVYHQFAGKLSQQPQLPTLEVLWQDARARLAINRQTGQVELLELLGDSIDDPVEVYFVKFDDIDVVGSEEKVRFPSLLKLQYGREAKLVLVVESIELSGPNTQAEVER